MLADGDDARGSGEGGHGKRRPVTLRSINTIPWNDGSMFQLKIDAQYPWRALVLSNPTRLVVDIGGMQQSVSDRIAVYSPASMVHFELVAGARCGDMFSTQVTLPASVRGQVTLEVFEASVRDGTPVGLVAVPLVID